MSRRVAWLFALILFVNSTSFALSSGCSGYLCASDLQSIGDEVCIQPISEYGGGNLSGCTTVRQCNSAHECIRYCRATYCYYV